MPTAPIAHYTLPFSSLPFSPSNPCCEMHDVPILIDNQMDAFRSFLLSPPSCPFSFPGLTFSSSSLFPLPFLAIFTLPYQETSSRSEGAPQSSIKYCGAKPRPNSSELFYRTIIPCVSLFNKFISNISCRLHSECKSRRRKLFD